MLVYPVLLFAGCHHEVRLALDRVLHQKFGEFAFGEFAISLGGKTLPCAIFREC